MRAFSNTFRACGRTFQKWRELLLDLRQGTTNVPDSKVTVLGYPFIGSACSLAGGTRSSSIPRQVFHALKQHFKLA